MDIKIYSIENTEMMKEYETISKGLKERMELMPTIDSDEANILKYLKDSQGKLLIKDIAFKWLHKKQLLKELNQMLVTFDDKYKLKYEIKKLIDLIEYDYLSEDEYWRIEIY